MIVGPWPYVSEDMIRSPLQNFLLRWGMGDGAGSNEAASGGASSKLGPEASSTSGPGGGKAAGQRKAPAFLDDGIKRRRGSMLGLLVAALALAILWGCGADTPQEGVISTENAGRVAGSIVRSDGSSVGDQVEIRLLRLPDSAMNRRPPDNEASLIELAGNGVEFAIRMASASTAPVLVARIRSDSAGNYLFPEVQQGIYRVDAILPGGLRGSSGSFQVESGKTATLVVVLVVAPSFQFALIPSAGDSVLSVWAGDPGREATRDGNTWTIPVLEGVQDAVGVVVRRASGSVETLLYRLVWTGSVAYLEPDSSTAAAPKVDAAVLRHFPVDSTTVASWSFDTLVAGVARDVSGNGHDLSALAGPTLESSPFGKAATTGSGYFQREFDSSLAPAPGRWVVYEARVFLDRYPSSALHNGRSVVLGFYEGPKLLVTDTGSLQIIGQRSESGNWAWAGGESVRGLVPLGRWVDLAMAVESNSGVFLGWIDGVPVRFQEASGRSGGWRTPATEFVVGKDSRDGQAFAGRIDEIRVSRQIPSSLPR